MPVNQQELEKRKQAELEERIELHFTLTEKMMEGAMCKQFFNSGVGRFLLDKATMDAQTAKDRLALVRLSDYETVDKYHDAIRTLQERAHTPALIFTWITEAIRAAEEAEIQLSNEEINKYGDY